ncbi:MAG: OmpA family protein [Deferrisomatales bacterium]
MALGAGCGPARRATFVLLPEPDGSAGRVEVSTPAGTQVWSRPFEATSVRAPGATPTPAEALDPADVERRLGAVLEAQPPAPVRFVLPFEEGKAELTEEGRSLLAQVREAAPGGSPRPRWPWRGTPTPRGDAQANYRVGLERAQRVAGLLAEARVDPEAVEVASHGEGNPLVPTADGVREPRNRRVEVVIR